MTAVEAVQTLSDMRKSPVERYHALVDAARCFGRAMELQSLIDEILRRAEDVMQAGACSIFLPDTRTGDLVLYSTDPRIATLPEPLRVPPGAGIAGAVFQSRKIINVTDARSDPRHYAALGKQLGVSTRAMVTIPLLDGASCRGVMQALNPKDRDFFDAEDEEIFEGFGGLIVNALVHLEAQRREIEQAQAREQLLLAREIQESFLPAPIGNYSFCQVHHHHLPAQTVSGDFGFAHAIGGNRLLVGLGDVCGKGFPAALNMARATAIIQAMTDPFPPDLGTWVTALNRVLARELKAGRFITLTVLLADAEKSQMQLCTAGQFPPFHFDGRTWLKRDAPAHLPLGILPDAAYRSETATLRPGDFWLLFTDGIPEARNPKGEEYGCERFLASLPMGETAPETLSTVFREWSGYGDSATQHDDASVLMVAWRGQRPASDLKLTCCLDTLQQARRFVEQWAAFAGFSDKVVGQIVMACDEACTNIFRHGYQQQPGPMQLSAAMENGNLIFRIVDKAAPVDSAGIQGRALSDLRPGGLGTVVINKVFDEVTFSPSADGNTLTLRKSAS